MACPQFEYCELFWSLYVREGIVELRKALNWKKLEDSKSNERQPCGEEQGSDA